MENQVRSAQGFDGLRTQQPVRVRNEPEYFCLFVQLFFLAKGNRILVCHRVCVSKRYWRSFPIPRSFTTSSALTRVCCTSNPQCRCGPVTRPVAPTLPKTVPGPTVSPTWASIPEKWQ